MGTLSPTSVVEILFSFSGVPPDDSLYDNSNLLLGEWTRATKVVELWLHSAKEEGKCLHGWCDNAIECRWLHLCGDLVDQAEGLRCLDAELELSVLDGLPVDGVVRAISSVASEWTWVEQVHRQNLLCDEAVGVRRDTVDPVGWESFVNEERVHRRLVWDVVWSRWHQLVQERSSAEEKERKRAEEEVGVLNDGLVPTLTAVDGKVLAVVKPASGARHHVEQRAVEREVVATSSEEVVTGEGCVCFELVVTCKTWLAASQQRVDRCPCCRLRFCQSSTRVGAGCGFLRRNQ